MLFVSWTLHLSFLPLLTMCQDEVGKEFKIGNYIPPYTRSNLQDENGLHDYWGNTTLLYSWDKSDLDAKASKGFSWAARSFNWLIYDEAAGRSDHISDEYLLFNMSCQYVMSTDVSQRSSDMEYITTALKPPYCHPTQDRNFTSMLSTAYVVCPEGDCASDDCGGQEAPRWDRQYLENYKNQYTELQ